MGVEGGRDEGMGRVGSGIKRHDEKTLGGEINDRWEMKKGGKGQRIKGGRIKEERR